MLMSLDVDDIVWFYRDYNWVEPIYNFGDFHNGALISARGGVSNYNHVLSLRQLGYLLKSKPEDTL